MSRNARSGSSSYDHHASGSYGSHYAAEQRFSRSQYDGARSYARSNGGYNSADYSRGAYARGNYGSHSNGGGQRKKTNKLVPLIALVVIIALVLTGWWYYHTLPINITVNGVSQEVSYKTTYADLHDQGLLTATNGDLLAVDGSVLTAGGGNSYKVFVNEKQLDTSKYSDRVAKDASITDGRGDDTTEDASIVETTTPWTWEVQNNHYKGAVGFVILPGTDGAERMATGSISGITALSDTSTAMVPRTIHYYNPDPEGRKVVCLTFDDGPSEYTQDFLNTLTKYGGHGTFFELGQNVEEYPELTAAVVAQGSQVASHSYDHPYFLNTISRDELTSELTKAQTAIENASGVKTTVVRCPGGEWDDESWQYVGDLMTAEVFWNIDTEDWKKPGVDSIVQMAKTASSGDIVLMHDGGGNREQSAQALEQICAYYQSQGFEMITIDELIQLQKDALIAEGVIPAA